MERAQCSPAISFALSRISHPPRPSDYVPGTQNKSLITRQGITLGRRLLNSGCVCFVSLVTFGLMHPAFCKKHLTSFSKNFVCAYMSLCVSVHGGQTSVLLSVCSLETGSLGEHGTCIFSARPEASKPPSCLARYVGAGSELCFL